jgi:hypothetical protein
VSPLMALAAGQTSSSVVEVHSEIAARLKAGAGTLPLTVGTTVFLDLEPAVLSTISALTANVVPSATLVLTLVLETVVPLLAGAATRLSIAVLAVKTALATVPLLILEMFRLMDSAERMARLAREVPLETVVLPKETAARLMTIALLAASLNSAHAPPRLISPPTVNVARTVRSAKEASSATAVPPKDTAERRQHTVTQGARVPLVPVTMQRTKSPRMASAARMERRAREVHSETVAHLRVGAVRRKTTAVSLQDVSLSSELATQHPATSPPMVSAVRTGKSARVVNGVIAAPRTDTVEKAMTIVAMAAKKLLVSARAFPPTLSAGLEMARRVWVLVLETVVLRTDSAELLTRTAVKAGKLIPFCIQTMY